MDDIYYLTAVDAIAHFQSGDLSPVELMEATIARAETVEPKINAFAETRFEQALVQAKQAERRYASHDGARPLEGLPVAVKEEAPIAGQRNCLGSLVLRDVIAEYTAPFVQRIIDAGGIIHARTTTPEFSCAPFTWSRMWGVTRNPWNLEFSPGGSSGGSAASLVTGTSVLATGSDIGGSIRIPASFCGVVGFKPPYGRVPELELFNLDHYAHEGPLARTVTDCALLENVIAGPHPSDIASLRPKLEIPLRFADSLRGVRVAFSSSLGDYIVEEHVAANAARSVECMRQAGATVESVELPWSRSTIARAARIHFGIIFGSSLRDLYETHREELTPYACWFVEEANKIPKEDFAVGLQLEAAIYAPLGELLESFDVLVCPTFAVPALPAEYDTGQTIVVDGCAMSDWLEASMTIPFNIASRCPVLSVPSGRAPTGVPTGISIVGRTYDDVTVFKVAAAFEKISPWLDTPTRRPLR